MILALKTFPETPKNCTKKLHKTPPKKSPKPHLFGLSNHPKQSTKRPKQRPEMQQQNSSKTDLKQQPKHQNNEERRWVDKSKKHRINRPSNGRVTPFLETIKEVRPEGTLLLIFFRFIYLFLIYNCMRVVWGMIWLLDERDMCSLLWYIGWKPGRKFHSRFWMDGSMVCTRVTLPRTT